MEKCEYIRFVGARIRNVWIVWNESWGEIEQSSPVVVETSRGQLELWAVYIAELDITTDTVDLGRLPPNYDGCDLSLSWTNDKLPAQQAAQGKLIARLAPASGFGGAGLEVHHATGAFVGANIGDEIGLAALPERAGE